MTIQVIQSVFRTTPTTNRVWWICWSRPSDTRLILMQNVIINLTYFIVRRGLGTTSTTKQSDVFVVPSPSDMTLIWIQRVIIWLIWSALSFKPRHNIDNQGRPMYLWWFECRNLNIWLILNAFYIRMSVVVGGFGTTLTTKMVRCIWCTFLH